MNIIIFKLINTMNDQDNIQSKIKKMYYDPNLPSKKNKYQ